MSIAKKKWWKNNIIAIPAAIKNNIKPHIRLNVWMQQKKLNPRIIQIAMTRKARRRLVSKNVIVIPTAIQNKIKPHIGFIAKEVSLLFL